MRILIRRKTRTICFAIMPSRCDGRARKRRRVAREDEQRKGWVEEGMNCSSGGGGNDDSNDEEEYFSADDDMHAADKNEGMPLTPGTIEAGYVSALVDLWTEQKVANMNPFPTPRGTLVKALLHANRVNRARLAHENFEDRAIG